MHHPFAVKGVQHRGQKLRSVRRSGNDVRLHKSGGLLRERLSVAARQGDYRIRIFAAEMPEHLAGFFIPHPGYGAGVYHVNIRRGFRIHYFKARFLKSLLHNLRFVLVDLATQCIKSRFHLSSHYAFILYLKI